MANTLEPVDHPKVKIDGLSYSLKFGPGAQLRLERMGLGPQELREAFIYEMDGDKEKAVGTKLPLTVLFSTLAACAGTPLQNGRWKAITHSAEDIADMSTPEDITAYGNALGEMWSKVKPEGTTPATIPADPTTPDPKLN